MEELLEELAEIVFEVVFKAIVKVFRFFRKTLIPALFLCAANAVHKKRLKRFNDELDLKAEDVRSDEEYFDKKQ